MLSFSEQIQRAWQTPNNLLCVGLDPDPARFPHHIRNRSDRIFEFCKNIVDATADLACAFKPQIAYFAAHGAEDQLEALIDHIHLQHPGKPVILDAKRGDIGSTAEKYAQEAFERYRADAVTLNPYMGSDTLAPSLARPEKGVFILCRTSNPGGDEFQMLDTGGQKLYELIAHKAAHQWNQHGNCGLVVGATYPAELARVREIVGPNMPFLVPGIGTQGGDAQAVIQANGQNQAGLLINASRSILYASQTETYAQAARQAAQTIVESFAHTQSIHRT